MLYLLITSAKAAMPFIFNEHYDYNEKYHYYGHTMLPKISITIREAAVGLQKSTQYHWSPHDTPICNA